MPCDDLFRLSEFRQDFGCQDRSSSSARILPSVCLRCAICGCSTLEFSVLHDYRCCVPTYCRERHGQVRFSRRGKLSFQYISKTRNTQTLLLDIYTTNKPKLRHLYMPMPYAHTSPPTIRSLLVRRVSTIFCAHNNSTANLGMLPLQCTRSFK